MNSTQKVIFIYGPTASGKTGFAEQIAHHAPIEIINMDSSQIYTPLNIGTAKTDWKKSPIAYHGFDIFDEPAHLTVHDYRSFAERKVTEITARNNIPVFVGGSGFYLKSLLFKVHSQALATETLPAISKEKLWDTLHNVDPVRARQIHPHDHYRIKRALAIWYNTGQKPSRYVPTYDPIAPFVLAHLTRERKQLYERINKRVHEMIHQGLVQEVKQLIETPWEEFIQEKGIIGYPEICAYIYGYCTQDEAIEKVAQRTRNYAKRQETFWRMLKKQILQAQHATGNTCGIISEFNLTYHEIDLYIKQLLDDFYNLNCDDYESN